MRGSGLVVPLVFALAAASVIACGGTQVGAGDAGSDAGSDLYPNGPPPTAYVFATVQQGGGTCIAGTGVIDVFTLSGGGSGAGVAGVPNGATYEESPVSVACTVAPSASGFTVSAGVSTGSGAFKLSGTMTSSGSQQNISAAFTKELAAGGVSYSESDCTFAFMPLGDSPAIKPGAVWGTLRCPDMTGSDPNDECSGVATVQLTNCTE